MFLTTLRERTYRVPAAVPFHLLSAAKNSQPVSHQVSLCPLLYGETVPTPLKYANMRLAVPVGSAFPQLPFALTGRGTREEKSKLERIPVA